MKRLRIVHIFSLFFIFLLFSPFIASADDAAVAGKAGIGIIVPPKVFFEVVTPVETGSTVTVPLKPGNAVSAPEKAVGNLALQDKSPAAATTLYQAAATAPTASVIDNYDQNKTASKAVRQNLGLFSTRIREKFSQWLSRSGKYLDLMKDILKKKDIPEDMVFLSLIESGFNPYAYSIARAAGPWQFIASTARRYGLEINWWKDERRDPIKSTEAAADYLKDLYGMFGSWNLAMAAYNAGEGKIIKALRRSNADDYWDLLGTRHIKEETKEYVPKFIAASLIANNPKDFGFDDIQYNQPMRYDEVKVDAPIDLDVAAECAGADLDTIKKLNPELRRWCTPPDVPHYVLRIPEGTKETFLKNLANIPDEERFTIDRYKVKKGDTFRRIARKTGIPASVILALNSTEKILPLRAGSTIYLPPKRMLTLDAGDRAFARKVSYVRKVSHKGRKKRISAKRRASRHLRHAKRRHGRKA
jgi:membrane-bound lytic murein transglycosylase D